MASFLQEEFGKCGKSLLASVLGRNDDSSGTWVAQSIECPPLGFSSGHDLAVREFEPRVGLWADGSEPGACFRFCVSLSLCPSPVHALSLSVSKINKR